MGERAARILGATSQGLANVSNTFTDLAGQQLRAEQQAAKLAQQKAEFEEQKRQAKEQTEILAGGRYDSIIERGQKFKSLSERKAFYKMKNGELEQMATTAGRKHSLEAMEFWATTGEETREAGKGWRAIKNKAIATFASGGKLDMDIKDINEAYNSFIEIAPQDDITQARKDLGTLMKGLEAQKQREREDKAAGRFAIGGKPLRSKEEAGLAKDFKLQAAGATPEGQVELAPKPESSSRLFNKDVLGEIKAFEKSKSYQGFREVIFESEKAETLLSQKKLTQAAKPVQLMMAAAFNRGRPSEKDMTALKQNPSFANTVQRFLSEKGLNKDILKDRKQLGIMVSALRWYAQEKLTEEISAFAKGTHKFLNISEEELAQAATDRAGAAFSKQKKSKKLSAKQQQALDWANKNPNDPRAAKIKAKLGQK